MFQVEGTVTGQEQGFKHGALVVAGAVRHFGGFKSEQSFLLSTPTADTEEDIEGNTILTFTVDEDACFRHIR